MKKVTKTIMRKVRLVVLLAFMPALLSAAQAHAVDYKNSYHGTQKTEYQVQTVSTAAPSASFQSTSAYSEQWAPKESTTPMLNNDGTVNDGAYMGAPKRPGSIRRDPTAPNPEVDEKDDDGNTPLGDAAWPLMLLLCAYAGYKARARKTQTGL